MARKDLPSPNASNFPHRLREEVHVLMGKIGGADRALTLRDAIESGIIVPGPGGSLIPGPGAGGTYEPDLTPPPQPGVFTATAAISHVLISQAQPFYTQGHGHSRTVVYGAQWTSGPLPVFADAVEVGRFDGTVWAMASNPATTWHLWIKWESNDGVLSATPSGGTNGVAVTTGQDVALLLDALAGQISASELATSLATPIGQIPGIGSAASEALAKANANLATIGTIQTELAELSGTPDYDAGTTYALDDIVKYSGGLYRALGTTTGNLPTNTTYWQKIGDYASLGDAVSAHSAQLSDHETRITANEGELTAEATARETLATQLRGSYAGTDIAMVSAGLIHSERQARSTADSTEVSARQALSAKLTGANDPASLTLGSLSSGLLFEERQARASEDAAQVGRIETLETAVNNPTTGLATKASLTQLATVESNAAGALATQVSLLQSSIAAAGNENLYLGPDPLIALPGSYGNAHAIKSGSDNPYKLAPGETLTISADLSQDAASAADGAGRVAQLFLWAQNPSAWVVTASISTASTTPQRLSATFSLPSDINDMHVVGVGVYHIGGNATFLGIVRAERIQVERGNVATAYKIGQRNLSAAIQTEATTRASQTGDLFAKREVKIDLAGHLSGYGLMSEASVNEAPTSAFGVRAGQFFVAPPAIAQATAPTADLYKGMVWVDTSVTQNVTRYYTGSAWSTTPQALPFVVQVAPTTINGVAVPPGAYFNDAFIQNGTITNAKIANLAVDDAKIANLSVSKLTAGSIAVGQYAQSTGYVAGSAGWRINGDGTAEFSGVVVRGTIFASQGAIGGWNIGSNYLQSTTYVLGESGTRLNSDGTGQIGGVYVGADHIKSYTFDTPGADFGFKLNYNGASEFKGAVIKSGTGKVLLSAVGDAVAPWVTTLEQADENYISLVADPVAETNTARLKSLSAGYGIDLTSDADVVTISEIPRAIALRTNQTQNSTTWVGLQGISWGVEAGETYEVEGLARVNQTTSGKSWQVAVLCPPSTVGAGVALADRVYDSDPDPIGVTAAYESSMSLARSLDANDRLVFGATQGHVGGSYGGDVMEFKASITTPTDGVVQIQFRRSSGSGSNTLQAGSWFSLRKATTAPELGELAVSQTFPAAAASTRSDSGPSAVKVVARISIEIKTDGTWYILRNGSTDLTGSWMQGAPLTQGETQNFDVRFEETLSSISQTGSSEISYYSKSDITASNWTQVSSMRKHERWIDVYRPNGGGTISGSVTRTYTVTVKVRHRGTGVITTLATIDCTLQGIITS